MKKSTKLKKQLEVCKEWAKKSRETNEQFYLKDIGLLYTQVAIEQIIEYLEMEKETIKKIKGVL